MSGMAKARHLLRRMAIGCGVAVLATLAGCGYTDPYQREGVWRASSVNAANLAVMVANPADLTQGRGSTEPAVRSAIPPVERLWRGPQQAPSGLGAALGAVAGAVGGAAGRPQGAGGDAR